MEVAARVCDAPRLEKALGSIAELVAGTKADRVLADVGDTVAGEARSNYSYP